MTKKQRGDLWMLVMFVSMLGTFYYGLYIYYINLEESKQETGIVTIDGSLPEKL